MSLQNTSNDLALTLENVSDFSPCYDCQTGDYTAENFSYLADNTTYSQRSQDAVMMVSEQTQAIIWLLNVVGIPAVIMVGFAGNSLCLFVVLGTHLRRQSTGVYLAFLSAVDSVFLFTLVSLGSTFIIYLFICLESQTHSDFCCCSLS